MISSGSLFGLSLAATFVLQCNGQGGPPMRTDDPGTPGNGNWEINLAATTERVAEGRSSELPLLDVNYGLGDRLQLKNGVALGAEGDGCRASTGRSGQFAYRSEMVVFRK